MELYLKISYLNDFVFCPLSIYYHQLYGGLSERLYYGAAQLEGKAVHEAIDGKRYSTHKNILQGMDVFSQEYNLCGRIDLFDKERGLLAERKKRVTSIYDGYIFQLYAQCLCLREMGYTVLSLRLYSSDDNKMHPIPLPEDDPGMFRKFKTTNREMQSFDMDGFVPQNEVKCQRCIYNDFCDRPLAPKLYNGGF